MSISSPVRIVNGVNGQTVSVLNALSVSDSWRVSLQSDEDANDSDKIFTVPASKEWQILWIWVELTSTGTAGDRQLEVEIQDSANDVIAEVARAGAVQAASLTRNYLFAPGLVDLTSFRDTDYLTVPVPPIFLKAGDQIRIFDNNAVDASADDMVIQMQIAERAI